MSKYTTTISCPVCSYSDRIKTNEKFRITECPSCNNDHEHTSRFIPNDLPLDEIPNPIYFKKILLGLIEEKKFYQEELKSFAPKFDLIGNPVEIEWRKQMTKKINRKINDLQTKIEELENKINYSFY